MTRQGLPTGQMEQETQELLDEYNELHPRPKSRYEQFQEWLNECPVEIANYLDYTDTFEVTFRVPLEDSAEGITQ